MCTQLEPKRNRTNAKRRHAPVKPNTSPRRRQWGRHLTAARRIQRRRQKRRETRGSTVVRNCRGASVAFFFFVRNCCDGLVAGTGPTFAFFSFAIFGFVSKLLHKRLRRESGARSRKAPPQHEARMWRQDVLRFSSFRLLRMDAGPLKLLLTAVWFGRFSWYLSALSFR